MQKAKETLTRHAGLEQTMQTSLRSIAKKAREKKNYRFGNLYQLINEASLREAWNTSNKKSASGVDKVTSKEYLKALATNIKALAVKVKEKKYRAKLVKRVYIEKSNGKLRPLGIPSLEDKLVQRVVARVLESIYEQDFMPTSYGYRPNTGAQKAVKAICKELTYGKYGYVVEADITSFFDNIEHEKLIAMLGHRIQDKAFVGLIKKWLKAGVMDSDKHIIHPVTGTQQGGVVSPILANIYLHYVLDLWFEKRVKKVCKGEAYICRYCDDFICAFRYKEDAENFYVALEERLKSFGLELSKEKTNIISFSRFRQYEGTSFDFLGFEFRWEKTRKGIDHVTHKTSKKKLQQSARRFKEWCKENRDKRIQRIITPLNRKLRGYYNYYGLIGNSKRLEEFYLIAMKTLYKWMNRRSQRKSYNWNEFNEMLKRYGVLRPRIIEVTHQQLQFDF